MPIEGTTLPAPAPLAEVLRGGLEAYPDRVALCSSERALTWRELDEARLRLAAGLPRPGAGARRPGGLADAEPHRPGGALPGLLRAPAWSPRRSTTATRPARSTTPWRCPAPRRCWSTPSGRPTWPPAGWPAGSRAGLPGTRGRPRRPALRGPGRGAAAARRPRPTRRADPPRSSSRRAARAPPRASHTRTRRSSWMCASAAAAFELTPGRRLPARLVDVAPRLVHVDARDARGGRSCGRRPQLGGGGDAAASARRAPHDPGDAPRGAGRPRA